jgi:hypothetical protein
VTVRKRVFMSLPAGSETAVIWLVREEAIPAKVPFDPEFPGFAAVPHTYEEFTLAKETHLQDEPSFSAARLQVCWPG